jgi:hypothetical protein
MEWKRRAQVAALAVAGLVACALAQPVAASAAAAITEVSLTPAAVVAGTSVPATLVVESSACITLQALTVAVRDSAGNHYDFPGAVGNPTICPSGYTLSTGARTFPAGTYTEHGAYELAGTWFSLPVQALTVGNAGSASAPSWDPGGTYAPAFDDEFAGSGVNTSAWEEGWFLGHGNTGISDPVNPSPTTPACYSSDNVSQPGDGYLHLALTATPSTCSDGAGNGSGSHSFTGALVDTRPTSSDPSSFSQAGGSFEARVYIPPASPSPGVAEAAGYPAVWLDGPASDPWPSHGEIDILEGLGGNTAAHLHYQQGATPPAWTSPAAYTGWHNLGASWDLSGHTVTIYWDGTAVLTHEFDATDPEYLILGYSLGSNSPPAPSLPSQMLVDWVHAWSL